jgi:DNA ligase 1
MKAFAELYGCLDETNSTNRKIAAMVAYFTAAPPEDAIWAVRFLTGRRPRQGVPTPQLITWAADCANAPEWLFEAGYEVVGDLAETIALLLPPPVRRSQRPLHHFVENHLLPLRKLDPEARRECVLETWAAMDTVQRFVWNKLITGGFRVGVSQRLVVRALAQVSGVEGAVIAHRLMGDWAPTAETYARLLSTDTGDAEVSRPYPFFLAYPLEGEATALGERGLWQVEWKWDGIRAQIVKRGGRVFIWSRGEELVTAKFPELAAEAARLPDGTALDGEILPWRSDRPLPFGELQRRIGRKKVGLKLLAAVPVVFQAYDLLEEEGLDQRRRPLVERRQELEKIIAALGENGLRISETVEAPTWESLAELHLTARSRLVEGFMLKRLEAAYGVGRRRGDWWKWKIAPLTVDAVLIYAQYGQAGRYRDYTFAVRDGEGLVPFAKADSGLTDAEIREVDRFIRRNTVERFGPVRAVRPELVFEIAFDAIQPSSRHKSGLAVRFPRIHRWRRDKGPTEADTRATLAALMTTCDKDTSQ